MREHCEKHIETHNVLVPCSRIECEKVNKKPEDAKDSMKRVFCPSLDRVPMEKFHQLHEISSDTMKALGDGEMQENAIGYKDGNGKNGEKLSGDRGNDGGIGDKVTNREIGKKKSGDGSNSGIGDKVSVSEIKRIANLSIGQFHRELQKRTLADRKKLENGLKHWFAENGFFFENIGLVTEANFKL